MLSGYFWWRLPGGSVEELASSLKGALSSGDPAKLASLISKHEREMYVDPVQWREVFKQIISPALAERYDQDHVLVKSQADCVQVYIPPRQGSPIGSGIAFTVTTGRDGPEIISFIPTCVRIQMATHYVQEADERAAYYRALLKLCENDAIRFESLGLRGVWSFSANRFEPWEMQADAARQGLDKIHSSLHH